MWVWQEISLQIGGQEEIVLQIAVRLKIPLLVAGAGAGSHYLGIYFFRVWTVLVFSGFAG